MILRHLLGFVAAGLLFGGCSNREPAVTDTASAAGSSSAPPESAPAADSAVVADSTLPPPSDATGNLTGETRSRDPVIGRDSAFGPIGTMDSDGTVRPIRK